MIGLIVLILLFFFFMGIIMYLVILGSNMNKTNSEEELEYLEKRYQKNKDIEKNIKKLNKS